MCASQPSMSIPTVVITPSTPNFSDMPFERSSGTERSEKLHGLGLGLGSDSTGHSLLPANARSRKQPSRWRGLALSVTVIALFILVLVGPTVPLRRLISKSVSRDVDALKSYVGLPSAHVDFPIPSDDIDESDSPIEKRQNELRPYRPSFGPGQGRRSSVIEAAKREAVHQRRAEAAWRTSAIDDAIAHKLADLHGPGGVSAAAVYTSQEHYEEDRALDEKARSLEKVESEEVLAVDEPVAAIAEAADDSSEETTDPPAKLQLYNLPAAPMAPWSLENEINAKQKEAGRLASS